MAAETVEQEIRRIGKEVGDALSAEWERLRRENRDLQFVLAILLRKLGGDVFISDGEQVTEDATFYRVPAEDGYRLVLRENPGRGVVRIRAVPDR